MLEGVARAKVWRWEQCRVRSGRMSKAQSFFVLGDHVQPERVLSSPSTAGHTGPRYWAERLLHTFALGLRASAQHACQSWAALLSGYVCVSVKAVPLGPAGTLLLSLPGMQAPLVAWGEALVPKGVAGQQEDMFWD